MEKSSKRYWRKKTGHESTGVRPGPDQLVKRSDNAVSISSRRHATNTSAIGAWIIGNSIPSLRRNGSKVVLIVEWGILIPLEWRRNTLILVLRAIDPTRHRVLGTPSGAITLYSFNTLSSIMSGDSARMAFRVSC